MYLLCTRFQFMDSLDCAAWHDNFKDLLNSRMAYVSVSRGRYDAQFFTNDREKLGAALGHDVSHQSAHGTERTSEQSIAPQREIGAALSPVRESRKVRAKRREAGSTSALYAEAGCKEVEMQLFRFALIFSILLPGHTR